MKNGNLSKKLFIILTCFTFSLTSCGDNDNKGQEVTLDEFKTEVAKFDSDILISNIENFSYNDDGTLIDVDVKDKSYLSYYRDYDNQYIIYKNSEDVYETRIYEAGESKSFLTYKERLEFVNECFDEYCNTKHYYISQLAINNCLSNYLTTYTGETQEQKCYISDDYYEIDITTIKELEGYEQNEKTYEEFKFTKDGYLSSSYVSYLEVYNDGDNEKTKTFVFRTSVKVNQGLKKRTYLSNMDEEQNLDNYKK